MTVTQATCYYCDEPCTEPIYPAKPLCIQCEYGPVVNEQIAQAFNQQVKKEHDAVLTLLKKWGVKPA